MPSQSGNRERLSGPKPPSSPSYSASTKKPTAAPSFNSSGMKPAGAWKRRWPVCFSWIRSDKSYGFRFRKMAKCYGWMRGWALPGTVLRPEKFSMSKMSNRIAGFSPVLTSIPNGARARYWPYLCGSGNWRNIRRLRSGE